jgi:hypothetical protein
MRRILFEICFCSALACTLWLSLTFAVAGKVVPMLVSCYGFTIVFFAYENAASVYFGKKRRRLKN